MKIQNPMRWNIKASAVYALGVWTLIGSLAYFKYTGRLETGPEQTEFEDDKDEPNQTVYQGHYVKTIVVRKENFVPYTTRLYRYVTSFMDETKSEK